MKTKTFFRDELVRSIIAVIVMALLVAFLTSCEEEKIWPEPVEYTFFVCAEDRNQFNARVDWGINGLSETEYVTTWGFASSVEVFPGDNLVVKVSRPLVIKVTNNNTREVVAFQTLRADRPEKFDLR